MSRTINNNPTPAHCCGQHCRHNIARPVRTSQRMMLPIRALRFVLAVGVLMLASAVCLIAAFTSNPVVTDKLLPFITPLLTLVLYHYFGRHVREQ